MMDMMDQDALKDERLGWRTQGLRSHCPRLAFLPVCWPS